MMSEKFIVKTCGENQYRIIIHVDYPSFYQEYDSDSAIATFLNISYNDYKKALLNNGAKIVNGNIIFSTIEEANHVTENVINSVVVFSKLTAPKKKESYTFYGKIK